MTWQVGLYVAAVLIPLAAFVVEILGGRWLKRNNALVATGAIGLSFVLSLIGFLDYFLIEARSEVFAGHAEIAQEEAQAETKRLEDGRAAPAPTPEHEGTPAHARKMPPTPVTWKASFPWVAIGEESTPNRLVPELEIPLGVHIDNVTVIMFLMVTFIATLIHIYSMGYMHDDARYPLFFTYLSLFCFSMLGLVAADNVFMIFIFWELVGVCSYFLIGFWHEEKKNSDAANKAFITNRVGDVGMLVGMGLLWSALGTFNIEDINRGLRASDGSLNQVGENVVLKDQATGEVKLDMADGQPRAIPIWVLTIAGLGIFAGCVGKSAQFPLHVWLPDAMAGPTPVSAMVHAATMVAAGVYLVGRFFPVFTEPALLYIAYTGGITLFIAATIAMVQTDYKKVLAYSTVSQLGFMMLGMGVGGRAAGLFHLLTHAFFKALLFLGAGSVYHAVHTYEMPVLGGLYRKMKGTALTMLVATLAISGVPFFSGFYSKDAILASSMHFTFTGPDARPEHFLLFVLPVLGAAVTAFYMFRMWFLVFGGESRGYPDHHDHHVHGNDARHDHKHPAEHAHESGPLMLWPLYALAVPSIFVGWTWIIVPFFGFQPVLEQLIEYGEPIVAHDLESAHLLAMGTSILIATAGIGLGFVYYSPFEGLVRKRFDPARTAERYGPIYRFLKNKWYFDELYDLVLIRPTLTLARWVSNFDRYVIDGVVNGSAWATARLSKYSGRFDNRMIDGMVNGLGDLVYKVGDVSRGLQTGRLRNYLMFLAVAVVGLFAGVFAWVLS
jgi:proton-translocating NADH-quinone oxidoreductase chain L